MWMNEPYAQLEVRNNHIIARTTATPRTEGLFGFNDKSDFKTFAFKAHAKPANIHAVERIADLRLVRAVLAERAGVEVQPPERSHDPFLGGRIGRFLVGLVAPLQILLQLRDAPGEIRSGIAAVAATDEVGR